VLNAPVPGHNWEYVLTSGRVKEHLQRTHLLYLSLGGIIIILSYFLGSGQRGTFSDFKFLESDSSCQLLFFAYP
jgi:hypothetical protein